MEEIESGYKIGLENLRTSISRIDRKTSTMLQVGSFIVASTSLTKSYINSDLFIPTIVCLCIAIVMFLFAVVPIIRVGKVDKQNPLYVFNIKTKGENKFLLNEPTAAQYQSQIRKFRCKLLIKYIFFYIGMTFLVLSLILFIVGLCQNI